MIVLDTHVWVWWVQRDERLSSAWAELIRQSEANGLGVSAISCWEVAKLVERGRLALPCDIDAWLRAALAYPGVLLLPLAPSIAAESTRLPGEFHSDPADQIIVATARIHGCPLLTADAKIRAYRHVNLADAR
ncbi:type II toxin-antitoxin system VapC family toxin [Sorangium atrum]|uniref:Ribonuclease VapC n=1 Tax=Sorangium atrum TaxID=2995308 RepID=A0ABT5BU81_9BACT|nr:type II toxin-antitoxin system VapC family toxin [Sorangium aterium]MDC0676476.1 type II toxin-antitoxin system VapC family toxin [Sorangium aterium]